MYPWIILSILCSLYCQRSESRCNSQEYQIDGRCCSLCRPGHWLSRDCTEHNETVCIPCPAGEFHEKYHRETSCLLHLECNEQLGFEKIREGTSTLNVLCRCQVGKHCSSQACETCVLNTVCGPGEGVVQTATSDSDTKCSPCEVGTYSDTKSDTAPCISWRKCDDGEPIILPGNRTADVVCGPSTLDENSYAWIYILLVLVLFVVIVLTAIILFRVYRKHKNKNRQKPPKENNQQQLIKEINQPEEDQDDQDITMQGLPVAQEQGKDYRMSQEEV